jgi:hypothetical protein
MADRKRLQRARQKQRGAGRDEEILHNAPVVETADKPLVQRAHADPESLSPGEVLQLQRTFGNRAVNNMLANHQQKPTIQRKPTRSASPAIQRSEATEQEDEQLNDNHQEIDTAALESAITRQMADAPMNAVQRNPPAATKNVSQGSLSEAKGAASGGTTAMGVYNAVKRGMEILNGAKAAAGEVFKGALTEFANLLTGIAIPGFVSLIKRIYDAVTTYLGMSGLKDAHDKLAAKAKSGSLTPDETKLKEASAHGFGKVKRRFYKSVYLVVSSVIKIAAHFVTILSGGTAALASELVAAGATLLEGLQTLYEKAKGFFKWLRNKRGVHRKQSADTIINSALNKDPIALKVLVDLNAYSTIRNEKYALKHGHGGVDTPETPDEMYKLLVTFKDEPTKYGSLTEYHDDVMKKLKSG